MSNDKAWDDSEVYLREYANSFATDLGAGIGLNVSDVHDPSTWMCVWNVGADSIFRYYKDRKLLRVKTPEPGLSTDLLGELAGAEIVADDVVSMTFDMDQPGITIAVNDRMVVIGERCSDGGAEWWACSPNNTELPQTHTDSAG